MRPLICIACFGVVLGSLGAVASTSDDAPAMTRTQAAIVRLQAADEQTRRAAKAEILEMYKELAGSLKRDQQVSDLPEYQRLVDALIAIVQKQREKYEEFDEKLLAVELLGDLRAAKAVDVLLDNILFRPPLDVTEKTPSNLYPCVGALIKVGSPSVEGILKRLDTQYEDPMVVRLYAIVIGRVEGKEAGKVLLQAELVRAKTRHANVAELLPHFSGTISGIAEMMRDPDPQVQFAAAKDYARLNRWPAPPTAPSAEERAKFVADTLARIEREGGPQAGANDNGAQPKPASPASRAAPAE